MNCDNNIAHEWLSWGCSVIGPAHIKSELPNQDAFSCKTFSWGDVVVVSDGVGSCKHADTGSRAVCSAVTLAAELLAEFDFANAAKLLPVFITKIWHKIITPLPPRDCSATCIFVIRVNSNNSAAGVAYCGMLGDGLLAGIRNTAPPNYHEILGECPDRETFTQIARALNNDTFLLSEDKGSAFSNMTTAISTASLDKWKIKKINAEDYNAFILCTDGIADDLVNPDTETDNRAAFVRQIADVYFSASHSSEFATADFRETLENWPTPGHSDDKTFACLYRREASQ